jgi:electron transport complex protein RnfB
LAVLGAAAGFLGGKSRKADTVWQIDPYICVACGNCATYCVLEESAVKCVHAYAVPYYEYTIDEKLCNGCGKCVKGCNTFGNGSLFLQVRHDRCENCNECAIAVACPSGAFKRVPADKPYLLKKVDHA